MKMYTFFILCCHFIDKTMNQKKKKINTLIDNKENLFVAVLQGNDCNMGRPLHKSAFIHFRLVHPYKS